MKYVNYKKIMMIMMSGFVLSSSTCSLVEAKEITEVQVTSNNEDIVYQSKKVIQNVDKDIVKYFKKQKKMLSNSPTTQKAKKKAIKSFITMTDFIFYGSEINGITYDELKDATKENIIADYFEVDSIIENKFPNYKNTIGEKYNNVKNWLQEKYDFVINKGKENLSNNSVDNIKKSKEELEKLKNSLKDTSESLYEDGKQKAKSWYDEFKKNHK